MSILQEESIIDVYKVQCLIKQNEYTETYRVVDEDEHPYFLKLYVLKRTPTQLILDEQEVLEISLLRKTQNTNVISYISHGSFESPVGTCQYVVTTYFTGEILADKITKEGKLDETTAMNIFTGIVSGLVSLNRLNICHNDITPANVMLSHNLHGKPELIDFGHASAACSGTIPFSTKDLDIRYCSNATAAGIFNEKTDIFSAFATLFTMLTGTAPWEPKMDVDNSFAIRMNRMKRFRKENPIDIQNLPLSNLAKVLLMKGLALDGGEGYKNIEELICDLPKEQLSPDCIPDMANWMPHNHNNGNPQVNTNTTSVEIKKGTGRGFEDIAGMQSLKDTLQKKVIFVIQNKEKAEKYRLTPPNGMLLYGPPGCGKTFFAEKFAEQTSFNFMLIKSSDLASTYIHGTQEKIGELFKKAELNAPIVICFDEFDAFVPNRSFADNSNISSEVNEFLTQLNNCAGRGIFVVATTNRPDMIDPAVLRTGRIDKHIFVPLPDHDARKEMFAIHLKGRPYEEKSIDFDTLATMTDGYIASDIAYIVNDAAMTAAFTNTTISQKLIEESIHSTSPSISKSLKEEYDKMREKVEGIERKNILSEIGFRNR